MAVARASEGSSGNGGGIGKGGGGLLNPVCSPLQNHNQMAMMLNNHYYEFPFA